MTVPRFAHRDMATKSATSIEEAGVDRQSDETIESTVCENRKDVPSSDCNIDSVSSDSHRHKSSNDQSKSKSNSGTALKRKRSFDSRRAMKKSSQKARNQDCRKYQKNHSKTDCPFCGVTLKYDELNYHVSVHAVDLFSFKRSRRRSHQVEPHPSHKKDFGGILKQRCERPYAQFLPSKSEVTCSFCKEQFVWRNSEGRLEAKNHLELCREQNISAAVEILQEVPSSSSAADDDFADINDISSISDDYLGSDTMRITGGDENQILDIENDDTVLYGPNQYCDPNALLLGVEGAENSEHANYEIKEEGASDREESDDDDEESNFQNDYTSVEGLKRKLRELHNNRGSMCPVCKDVYKTPLTAIGCWHILCENCWLTALAVKKICPVCKTIVSSDALRRVYL